MSVAIFLALIACSVGKGFALTRPHGSLTGSDVVNLRELVPQKQPCSKPKVALSLSGQIDSVFSVTAANLKNVLIDKMRQIADLDVFLFVKGKYQENLDAIQSLTPTRTYVYDDEPEDVLNEAWYSGVTPEPHTIWVQRYQWQQCWGMIISHEWLSGKKFDFVIHTRPDLLYNAVDFSPNTWGLWKDQDGDVASGLCKCGREDLTQAGMQAPVQDVFFVGPRKVAEVFMTTWSRRQKIRTMNKAEFAQRCYMYHIEQDNFECASIVDLDMHGFKMMAIPSLSVRNHANSSAWTLNSCEMPAQPSYVFSYLPAESQACIRHGMST